MITSQWIEIQKNDKQDFDLTRDQLVSLWKKQEGKCAITGKDLYIAEIGHQHNASIDRINRGKGYTVDNTRIIHKAELYRRQMKTNVV